VTKPRDVNDILREEGGDALRQKFDQSESGDWGEPQGHADRYAEPGNKANGAATKPLPRLEFPNIAEWDAIHDQEKDWLVTGRVPCGDVTLLSGHGGTGKTTIAGQLAVATIHRLDWLGTTIDKPGDVLFVTAELPYPDLRRRMRPILEHYNVTWRQMQNHFFPYCRVGNPNEDATLAIVDHQGILKPTAFYRQIEQAVADIRPRLIVMESLTDLYGGKEIEPAPARAQLRRRARSPRSHLGRRHENRFRRQRNHAMAQRRPRARLPACRQQEGRRR
jgi:AAA domain